MNTAQMQQPELDAVLAGGFEELREKCAGNLIVTNKVERNFASQTTEMGHDRACCRGLLYVPEVQDGPLVEALWTHDKILPGDIFGPEGTDEEWDVWLIPESTPAVQGTGSSFDLALRRAAVAAIEARGETP